MLRMAGRVVGILNTSHDGKGGSDAEFGEACASVAADCQDVLTLCVPDQLAAGGQKLFLNNRAGPLDAPVVPGCYALRQTFHLGASELKSLCCNGASAAESHETATRPEMGRVPQGVPRSALCRLRV